MKQRRLISVFVLVLSLVQFAEIKAQDGGAYENMQSPGEVLDALLLDQFPWKKVSSVAFSGDSLVSWAQANGTAKQLAMAHFAAFEMEPLESSNIYRLLVAGNGFWKTHQSLNYHNQIIGLDKLFVLYERVKRFDENLAVAVRYCEIKNEYEKADRCDRLGKVYYDLKQFNEALKYFRINVESYRKENNFLMAASNCNNIGNIYELMNKPDSAYRSYDKALDLLADSSIVCLTVDPVYYQYFRNIVRWNRASLKDGFEPARDIPELLQQVINAARLNGETSWVIKGYTHLMEWNYRNNRDNIAATYCDSAIAVTGKNILITELPELLRFKGQLHLLKGDKKNGQLFIDRAEQLTDSLQREDSQLNGIVAAAFHEAKEREKDIKTSKQEAESATTLAATEKKSRQLYTMLFALAVIILGIVAWLLWQTAKDRRFIRKQSEQLEKSLGEKEMLLKEIHHRVKNNLQVISSLLELQTFRMDEGKAKQALEEGKSRVQSIAILHHQLYQHHDLSKIELNAFTRELATQVMAVFNKPGQQVNIDITIPETLIDIDTAVPLGLILNELLTNSFKYAFHEGKTGEITIHSTSAPFILTYRDNGPGLPKDFEPAKARSLGLRLVWQLCKQLKGTCVYEFSKGYVFKL